MALASPFSSLSDSNGMSSIDDGLFDQESIPTDSIASGCPVETSMDDFDDTGVFRRAKKSESCAAPAEGTPPTPKSGPLQLPENFKLRPKIPDPQCKGYIGKPWYLTCGGPEFFASLNEPLESSYVANCENGKSPNHWEIFSVD